MVDAREAVHKLVAKRGGLTEISSGQVSLAVGKGQIEARLDEPGWLLVEVAARPEDGKKLTQGGALAAPDRIQPSAPRPDDFDAFWQGRLKDYPSIGNHDRDTSYFLRMYLSCFRGAQYLVERPDWDGRTLVVTGGSQGGLQSIVTAALHPKITAVLACVPAGCDPTGLEAKRLPGWPMWDWQTQGKDEAKVRAASRYYDVVNFASGVKCPVLVGVGLTDTVCPPPGVLAACNQLKGPKEVVVMPVAEHGEKNGSHRPYYVRFDAWDKALVKGDPAPVR